MDLPISGSNIGGAQQYAVQVKRHGLQLKIAKRFIDDSTYPWINFWLRLAGWGRLFRLSATFGIRYR